MLKKILTGIIILFVLLILSLIAIPYLFKDQINAALKTEIDKQINAKVDYSDYSLSLIKNFPYLSFGLNDLSVIGIDSFKGDTLVYVKNFTFSMDIMSVIHHETYKIKAINLDAPEIYASVDKQGHANWDIAKKSTEKSSGNGESSKFSLEIKKYVIDHARIIYDDKKGNTYLAIEDFNFSGNGDVTQDNYLFNTKTDIASITYRNGAISYLSKAKIHAVNDVDVDQKNSKYSFKSNEIDLNNLGLMFDGFVLVNKNNMAIDISFKSKEASFKSILSLIPAIYEKNFDQIKTSGSLALDGMMKGTYDSLTMPALKLHLKVDNAMFQYPSLPTAVTNINITANIEKPQGGMDAAVIDISKMHIEIGTDPVDAVIHVSTPVSDPDMTAKINGKIDLATIPKLYPMDGLKQMTGLLVATLDFKGRMSDVEKKNYQSVQAAGNITVTNMVYESTRTPMPVKVTDLAMTFNPKNVTLNKFDAVLGKSDFNASGTVDNFMGYLFSKGSLSGVVNLRSNNFDANEWLTTSTPKNGQAQAGTTTQANNSTPTQCFQVPKGIDFTATSQFNKISYQKLVLTNVKGTVHVFDEAIHLQDLSADLLGGNATINALYSTRGSTAPKVTFSYNIKNFDMVQTANTVDMATKMAPVLKYLKGSYSSDLLGSGVLKQDMSVDYNSLQGNGKIVIPSAQVVNMPILQKIADVTKVKALDNLAINNAMTVIKFSNGRVNVDPMDIKLGSGYLMNIKGSNGFDESIDYDIRFDVPTKELGGTASDLLSKIPQIPRVNIKMPETISITMKVGGTASKPTVSISKVGGVGGSTKDVINSAIDQAKQKAADEAKALMTKQGQEQAEKAAKDAADQLKNAAKGFKLPF